VVKPLNPLGSKKKVEWNKAKENVIGMYWHPASDDFKFSVRYHWISGSVMRTCTYQERISMSSHVDIRPDRILELLHGSR